MTRLGEDPITASRIPRMQTLYQNLGFDNRASQRKFGKSVADWRKNYKTPFGEIGTALINWRSDNHDLGVMAQRFVETGSNAHDFWPSEGGTSFQTRPRYPEEEVTILKLLRRFIWRQNTYSRRNTRYRNTNPFQNDRSSSEESFTSAECSPRNTPHTSQPSPPPPRQVLSRPADNRFIFKELSYNPATGLLSKSVKGTGALPVDDENWHRSPGPEASELPKSLPKSIDNPSNFRPRSSNSTPTTNSSNMPLKIEDSENSEDNTQDQNSQPKRSHPRPLGSNHIESESNKRRRISMLPELQSTSFQTLTSSLEASNDLNDQRNHLRRNVQLGNSDSPQSQPGPSPRVSSHSTTAQADPHTPTIRPEVNVLVVESSGTRITIKKWPGGTLKGRTLKSIFDEVSSMFSDQTLQTIKFQLQTLKKENGMECLMERDEDEAFEFMMQKFNERIRERIRAGETRLKLVLEPERGVEGATEGAVSEASGSEENYV